MHIVYSGPKWSWQPAFGYLNGISFGQGENDNNAQMITVSNPLSHKTFTIDSYLEIGSSAAIWSDHLNDKIISEHIIQIKHKSVLRKLFGRGVNCLKHNYFKMFFEKKF